MRPGHLVVRADARRGHGAGHVLRQLALAEVWLRWSGQVTFLLEGGQPDIVKRVAGSGAAVEQLEGSPETVAAGFRRAVSRTTPDWLVLDGYHLGPEVQAELRPLADRLAVVDDHGLHQRYEADVVVDQNLGPRLDAHDRRPAGSALLQGPRFALLRQEFRVPTTASDAGRRVVVLLGGEDHAAATLLADRIEEGMREDAGTVEVVTPTSSGRTAAVGDLLRSADVVVSGAGSTAWEVCCVGRAAVLVALADNQVPVASALAEAGAAVDAGPVRAWTPGEVAGVVAAARELLDDPERRADMGRAGRRLVDGEGAIRVATELRSSTVALRDARDEDARLLWEWVNDPAVREASFNRGPIAWEDHRSWFADRLAHDDSLILLAEEGARPWGQVRFDISGDTAEIGLSVAEWARGRGAAPALIRAGVRHLLRRRQAVRQVRARVRPENAASCSSFRHADFVEQDRSAAGPVELIYSRGRDGRS